MKELTKEQIEELLCVVRECGAIMRSAHDLEKKEDAIHEKTGSANFVTVYDVRVQNTLLKKVKEIVPNAEFFAEEKENNKADMHSGLCFVIDPIDGTTNFIHDYKASSISVGLLADGIPVFGVVYDPYRDEMFTASIGEGAFLNGKPIHVSDRDLSHALVCFGASPYNKKELADVSFSLVKELFLKCADIRRGGSAAIDLCGVACGRAEVFFEMVLSPWDYMASYVIVREAGGDMFSLDGAPLSLDVPEPIVCTNKTVNQAVLAVTKLYKNAE